MEQKNLLKLLNLYKFKSLKSLFEDLKEINYAYIKGESLSLYAYGCLGAREYVDYDILVDRKDLFTLEQILKYNGFDNQSEIKRNHRITLLSYSHQLLPYGKKDTVGDLNLDLNFDIFWGEYSGKRISIENFIKDCNLIDIYGCPVKVLTLEKTFIQLILHNYKELNSLYLLYYYNPIKEKMFKDVYMLLLNWKHILTPNFVLNICSEYNIKEYAYYVLYFTYEFYKKSPRFLERYLEILKTKEGEHLLKCYGLNDNERKLWNIDFNTRLLRKNFKNDILSCINENEIKKIKKNKELFG